MTRFKESSRFAGKSFVVLACITLCQLVGLSHCHAQHWFNEIGIVPAAQPQGDTAVFATPYVYLDTCGYQHGYISVETWASTNPDINWDKAYQIFSGYGPWPYSFSPLRIQSVPGLARSFTFKNGSIGWAAIYDTVVGAVYKTTDGLTWNPSSPEGWFHSVGYAEGSDRVFVSDFDSTFYSTDEGTSWNLLFAEPHWNFAFSTPLVGVAGGEAGGTLIYTSNGGITWQHSTLPGDEFQPLGIQGTRTFFVVSERGPNANTLFRSDDGGATWNRIYQFPTSDTVTGAIVGNDCFMFVQTSLQTLQSTDEGLSWSITPIYTVGNAKDVGMWSNGNVSIFPESYNFAYPREDYVVGYIITPYVVAGDTTFECTDYQKAFLISVIYDCHNSILQGIALTGSASFHIARMPTLPDTLRTDDSLSIQYVPQSTAPDTGYVIMNLCTPAGFLDTTIRIIGSGKGTPLILSLLASMAPSSTFVADTVALRITPDQAIQNVNLNQIDFNVSYNGDLLTYASIQSNVFGAAIAVGSPIIANGVTTLPVHLTGSNLSLDPTQTLASIQFRTTLTDSVSTAVTLSHLALNGGDSGYRCILTASIQSANFNLLLKCGDSTIIYGMEQKLAFVIQSITPNPTSGILDIGVRYQVPGVGGIEYELDDALGRIANAGSISGTSAHLDLSSIPSGSYYLRLSQNGFVQTRRVVLER